MQLRVGWCRAAFHAARPTEIAGPALRGQPMAIPWRLFFVPLLVAAAMAMGLVLGLWKRAAAPGWPTWLVVALAALCGAALPWTQRPPTPDTRPLNVAMPDEAPSDAPAFPGGRLGPR